MGLLHGSSGTGNVGTTMKWGQAAACGPAGRPRTSFSAGACSAARENRSGLYTLPQRFTLNEGGLEFVVVDTSHRTTMGASADRVMSRSNRANRFSLRRRAHMSTNATSNRSTSSRTANAWMSSTRGRMVTSVYTIFAFCLVTENG